MREGGWASLVKVIHLELLVTHCCSLKSRHQLWILSCEEAILLAYRTLVTVPLACEVMHRWAPEVFRHQLKLESHHIPVSVRTIFHEQAQSATFPILLFLGFFRGAIFRYFDTQQNKSSRIKYPYVLQILNKNWKPICYFLLKHRCFTVWQMQLDIVIIN